MRTITGLAACAAALSAFTAAAEEAPEAVHAKYQVESLEALAANGTEVYRAFAQDGRGTPRPMISFSRAPDGTTTVSVRVLQRVTETESRLAVLDAPVPADAWQMVVAGANRFDADPDNGGVVHRCTDSWTIVAEAATDGQTRSKTQQNCGNAPAADFAFDLAAEAIPLIPACAALDRTAWPTDMRLLEACATLHGDTNAAAAVLSKFDIPTFAEDAVVIWPGEATAAGAAAPELWARITGGDRPARLSATRVDGRAADRVTVQGVAWRSADNHDEFALFEQNWVRANDGFVVSAVKVGDFSAAIPSAP